MRQALGGVFALAAAALAEPALPGGARARMQQIIEQAEWLSDIIHDSLQAYEDPGRADSVLELAALASEAVATELLTYPGELELAWPAVPVFISGNRVTIRRTIANLLSNATRAAGPLGRVRVEAGYDRGQALLVIDDSGPGFGKIPRGTGLGLRGVVRSMDGCAGRLEYDRGSLGGARARLWVRLPAGWADPGLVSAAGPPVPSGSGPP